MAKQIPIKATMTGNSATGFGQFAPGDTIGIDAGGTGAITPEGARTALGTASLKTPQTFEGGQRGISTILVDATTVTPDFAVGNFFDLTMGGNRILANPANLAIGQCGHIVIRQNATGGFALSYGSLYKSSGGEKPVVSTAPNAVTVLAFDVISLTEVVIVPVLDAK